jgi:hypothetical protein
MKGHTKLIELRKSNVTPSMAFIYDSKYEPNWFDEEQSPEISIGDENELRRLDMRFLVGMSIFAYANTKERAIALFEALLKANCTMITVTWTGEIRQKHYWSRMYDSRTGFDELEVADELTAC